MEHPRIKIYIKTDVPNIPGPGGWAYTIEYRTRQLTISGSVEHCEDPDDLVFETILKAIHKLEPNLKYLTILCNTDLSEQIKQEFPNLDIKWITKSEQTHKLWTITANRAVARTEQLLSQA